jgi:FkbM family methyltransferase
MAAHRRVRLRTLFQRRDFRRNPVRALWRRVVWRVRWRVSRRSWVLSYRGHIRIAVPHDGLGSQLYYEGCSEPDIEELCLRFLRPGMVFFDVGAHVGKYTLLAARAVGPSGRVHAFEPNPELSRLLEHNISLNALRNVRPNQCAVSDSDGAGDFEACAEASVSSLLPREKRSAPRRTSRILSVPTLRLDTYCASNRVRPHLVKVDVEGAELLVFRGSEALLDAPGDLSSVWIFEHEPANYARFGYAPQQLFDFLRRHGYRPWSYREGIGAALMDSPPLRGGPVNLLAVREGVWLPSLL